IELIEQLLLLGAPAATAGRRGRCRPRAAAGPGRIVPRHDLQLALAHHPPQSANSPARGPEAQVDEAGGESTQVAAWAMLSPRASPNMDMIDTAAMNMTRYFAFTGRIPQM